MAETVEIAKDELERLRERAKKLATDKSYLQLIIQLMNKIGMVSGLEDTIECMLRHVMDVLGGANLILYYTIDNDIFYVDVYGTKQKLPKIFDPQVQMVVASKEPLEYRHDFKDTKLVSAEFTNAYTWVYPLKVGDQLIGVFKMESLHIGMRDLYEQLPIFFNYVALVLKNEILGYTRLQKVNQQLEQEIKYRKQFEKELRKAKEAAEAANRAKSVFLANMSHELRTPMNAVLGFSKIMQDDPHLTESQRQNLGIINRSGTHLLSLINDILDMAKIEAGKIVIESEPVDIGELVRDIVDMMRERAESKNLRLLHEESSNFRRFIETDPYKFRQILINLLGNAIKYTDEGGISLRFEMQESTSTPNKLLLICEVEDSGVGISTKDQAKIFEPFVQAGKNMSEKGTGLGLPITQQYIKLMGGSISVKSTPGKGSLFRVELPVNKVSAAEIMSIKPNQNKVVGLKPGQMCYRLLIVDDQPESRLLLIKLLQPLGFDLREASDGNQAVEIFKQWQPHLIWMDRRMPELDGLAATQKIKAMPNGKNTVIVALTASVFEDQRNELLSAGFDVFISKPYRMDEIFNCLHEQLGVQFEYASVDAVQDGDSQAELSLHGKHIQTLAPELQQQLYKAALELDMEQTQAVIERIKATQPRIAAALQQYTEAMDFESILNLYPTP